MSLNYSKRPTSLVGIPSASHQVPPEALTYETFFGLTEKPFSLNADARFVYESPTYVATRDGLLAGIRRREGLLVLTGEIGTGKTTLCRAVLSGLGRNTYSSLVPDPFASREDLLKMMLIDFGVLSIQELTSGPLRQASRTELGYLLSEFLNKLSRDAFVIVMIDEAQNLSLPLIEETRILSDTFGANGQLQIVFVGQPELHAKLKSPEMRQVDQRVCGYQRLAPMNRSAVAGYIQHRLQTAGLHRGQMLFPADIVESLHSRTGGVPRLINRVCDRALTLAYEREAASVDREIIDTALIEVGAATLSPTWDSIFFAESSSRADMAPVAAAPQPAVIALTAVPAPIATPEPELPAAPMPVPVAEAAVVAHDVDPAEPVAVGEAVADNFDVVEAISEPEALLAPETALTVVDQQVPAVETAPTPISVQLEQLVDTPAADHDAFKSEIEHWVAKELAAPSRPLTRQTRRTPLDEVRPAPRQASSGPRRRPERRADWSNNLRSETYVSRLGRMSLKWIAIGLGLFVLVNVALTAASMATMMLLPPDMPTAPDAPPRSVPSLAALVLPPPGVELVQESIGATANYLVAVGLYFDGQRADRLIDVLTEAGLPAMQRRITLRGQQMQQIVLGPFLTRADAAADLIRLRNLGGYDDATVIDGSREP